MYLLGSIFASVLIYAVVIALLSKVFSLTTDEEIQKWKKVSTYSKFANIFNGRINRRHFGNLFFYSIILLVAIVVSTAWVSPIPYIIIDAVGDDFLAFTVLTLITLYIPIFVAFTIRRFHDIGLSGWWSLLSFTPLVVINVLVLLVVKSQGKLNKYGEPVIERGEMGRVLFHTYISTADEANMSQAKKKLAVFSILILIGVPILYAIM